MTNKKATLRIITPALGMSKKLREDVARVIEQSISQYGQMPLFPHDLDDLRVPIKQAELVREKVNKIIADAMEVELTGDSFIIKYTK